MSAHDFGQGDGFAVTMNPDDFGRAFGKQALVVAATHFIIRRQAAATANACVQTTFHGSRMHQRQQESAAGIDDHRVGFAFRGDVELQGGQPFDTDLLHVAKINGVIDMAESVLIAPTNRDRQAENVFAMGVHSGEQQLIEQLRVREFAIIIRV